MKVAVLAGGGGGAKLVDGLAQLLPPDELTAIVNTGDDFVHLGLPISPDLDSVMYMLGGALDPRGWGRAGDSFRCLEAVAALGGERWFQLGDLDLAVHLRRGEALARGVRLTEITRELARGFGVAHAVLPMSDAPRPTWVDTAEGALPFQRWYVERRAAPVVMAVRYEGTGGATAEVLAALETAELVVIAPSNPLLSIGPILALPGVREQLARRRPHRRVVAVSPLVGGEAVTGPLARMLVELGHPSPSVATLAAHYGDLVDAWLVDPRDAGIAIGRPAIVADAIMRDAAGRRRVAAAVLDGARSDSRGSSV